MPPTTRQRVNRPYQITGVVCMLFAAFIARESIRLDFYSAAGPGPGFFPLVLSVAFAGLALAMFWQATFGRVEPVPAQVVGKPADYHRIIAIIAALLATMLLLETLGFRLAFLALYMVLMNLSAPRRWVLTTLLAVAGSFGIYQVFVGIFQIPLPVGILGF